MPAHKKLAGDGSKPNKNSLQRLGLIIKLQDPSAVKSGQKLIETLKKASVKTEIVVEEAAWAQFPKSIQSKTEKLPLNAMTKHLKLIVVLGGDGTILRCARYLLATSGYKKCGLLGVNAGRVGFLTSMNTREAFKRLPNLLQKPDLLAVEERMCLEVRIKKASSSTEKTYHILNDCVLSKGSLSRIFEFQADINGNPLSLYRADGLIVSPPTGSTAYNLAAGGSIVEPQIPAIQLTPIAAQSFSNKPILVSDQNTIQLKLRRHTTDIYLTLDGHTGIRIDDDDLIEIRKSEKVVRFMIPKDELSSHFFHSLRQKLNWGIVPGESS